MAGVLQHLRSSTLDKRPNPASMVDGQVAINYASGAPGMFFKDSNGSLVKVGPVHVGSGAPNASPASGGTAGNSLGEQWLDTSGGTYVFKVWDGSAWRSEAGEFVNVTGDTMTGALGIIAGSASTPGLFFSGDANSGLYSPGADQVAISSNGVGRLFIDASGRVGVGTSSLSHKLVVSQNNSGGVAAIHLPEDESTILGSTANTSIKMGGNMTVSAGGVLGFNTNGSERLRITSDGKLGLGTSSPGWPLSVYGSSNPGIGLRTSGGTSDDWAIRVNDTNNRFYLFNNTSGYGEVVSILRDGKVGIGDNAPSHKLVVRQNNSGGVAAIHLPEDESTILGSTANTNIKMGGNMTVSAGGVLGFNTNGSERARIDTSGNLLINNATSIFIGQCEGGSTSPSTANYFAGMECRLGGDRNLVLTAKTGDSGGNILFKTGYTTTGSVNERARIDSSGRLLVGTSSTSSNTTLLLQGYSGTSGPGVLRCCTTTNGPTSTEDLGYIMFGDATHVSAAWIQAQRDGGTWTAGSSHPGRLVFSTCSDGSASPSERCRIDSAGRLLIGQTSGSGYGNRLAVSGTATVATFKNESSTGGTAQTTIQFLDALDGSRGSISVNTSGTNYNTTSDYRAKENVVPLTGAIDRLKLIPVHRFNFISDPSKTVDGFIAHEAQTVVPECVTGEKDAVDDEGNPVYQGIDQSKLVPLLTAALQEAIGRIETLEAEVAALKA